MNPDKSYYERMASMAVQKHLDEMPLEKGKKRHYVCFVAHTFDGRNVEVGCWMAKSKTHAKKMERETEQKWRRTAHAKRPNVLVLHTVTVF